VCVPVRHLQAITPKVNLKLPLTDISRKREEERGATGRFIHFRVCMCVVCLGGWQPQLSQYIDPQLVLIWGVGVRAVGFPSQHTHKSTKVEEE